MSAPSYFEIELGKVIRSAFGFKTKVVRFGDDDRVDDCFIVSGSNCPVDGVTSYGSVGLSRAIQKAGAADISVEIVAACASSTPHIDHLVASCVFESAKNGTNITYGAQITDIVEQYVISKTLRHVTFVAPFLWRRLENIQLHGRSIHRLLMLPISDTEKKYLESNGIDALEALFNDRQIDLFDINRPSVLT